MKNLISTCIGLATLALGLGYLVNATWVELMVAVGLVGLLWLVGQRQDWEWTAALGMTGFAGLAAFGIWQGAAAGWMLVGLMAALLAWDLEAFSRRLEANEIDEFGETGLRLKQVHLQRLLVVTGIGLGLGLAALAIEIDLLFGWAMALGLLVVAGLSWLIGSMRRGSD